jgi:hypothetical protein
VIVRTKGRFISLPFPFILSTLSQKIQAWLYLCQKNCNMTTTDDQLQRLKFPIGPFKPAPADLSRDELSALIDIVEAAPAKYRAITQGMSEEDANRTYREGAWNIRQLINHLADMQLLHLFRMKRAITESNYDVITIVDQHAWAVTPDGLNASWQDSLDMFESITKRYVFLMRSLTDEQLARTYFHPVRQVSLNQRQAISMTAWHVQHHLEHIRIALKNS